MVMKVGLNSTTDIPKKGNLDIGTRPEGRPCRTIQGEDGSLQAKEGSVEWVPFIWHPEGTNPASTLISDSWSPKLGEGTSVLL